MPEIAFSHLLVLGTESDLSRFEDAVRGSDDSGAPTPLSLGSVYPSPGHDDPVLEMAWRSRHWATKWEPLGVTIERFDGGRRYVFQTPHSPPFAWCRAIAPQFPTLSFRLVSVNPSRAAMGDFAYRNGDTRLLSVARETHGEDWVELSYDLLSESGSEGLLQLAGIQA